MSPRRNNQNADDLFEVVAAGEPRALRENYLATPAAAVLHRGTTVPALGQGFVQSAPGALWVPSHAAQSPAPIDNFGQFMTIEELTGQPWGPPEVGELLARLNRTTLLTTCAAAINGLQGNVEAERTMAHQFADNLNEPHRTRAHQLIKQNRVVFTRDALLGLAKLVVAYGTDEATDELNLGTFGLLVLSLHDVYAAVTPDLRQDFPGEYRPDVTAWISANQLLHKSVNSASLLASFESRWAAARPHEMDEVCTAFQEIVGFTIDQQAEVAMAVWSGVQVQGRVEVSRSWFEPLGLDEDTLDKILVHLSIGLDEAREPVRNELQDEINWNFDTFERYPLLRLNNDDFIVLDTGLLLRKCLGWSPLYSLQGLVSRRRYTRYAQALERNAEGYALQILASMYEQAPTSRLFDESALRPMAPHSKVADAAVDFGGRWAVIEVTARRLTRNLVHGNAVGADELLDVVLDELRQASSTAKLLQTRRDLFTGESDPGPVPVYPVVLMTEGFPANPFVISEVRARARAEHLFSEISAAPIEIIDLEELELIEQLIEAGGPTLPDLIDAKALSNFHADSMKAYILATHRLPQSVPSRVNKAFSGPMERLGERLRIREALSPD